jgi:adenylylsulfate kinase
MGGETTPIMTRPGFVLWLLGPTSSGKTTIGRVFVDRMRELDVPAIHYDGNEIRSLIGPDLGFAPGDRLRAVSACLHLANKASDAGLAAVVSALTANEDARRFVREYGRNLTIGYLECSIEVCAQRDSLGLYAKARRGEIDPDTLIGFKAPYVPPRDPDIVLDTERKPPEYNVSILEKHFRNNGFLVF